jgi:hypothetical protein
MHNNSLRGSGDFWENTHFKSMKKPFHAIFHSFFPLP